jgi:hypothetical protein
MKPNNGPRLDKSCVYQSNIVTVVLHLLLYVYVHHINLYIFFIILCELSLELGCSWL